MFKFELAILIKCVFIQLEQARVVNLIHRPDYDGYGFSMRSNDKGPHQISNVESLSPAECAGLKADDYLLKVNDINVIGERYNKTVALIKNESEKGRLKLEVVEPHLCSFDIKNTALTPQSGYSTLTSSKGTLKGKNKSIDNLRTIAHEIIASGSGSVRALPNERQRAESVDVTDSRKRPLSMGDLDRVKQNSTVRSNMSYGSTTTAFSESK